MASGGVEVPAPGKVNLILRVLDRRPDGFHNLWSVMQAFELADTVIAEIGRGAGIQFSCEGADLPADSTNLAYRAAERVLGRTARRDGIRVHVRKRLPVAAGVGGGSSDAAAVVQALAMLFETGWTAETMTEIGREIGSDVPFFFYGPTALVEGTGERVTPLQLDEDRWLVLVNPGLAISTAWAYGKLAAARAVTPNRSLRDSLPGLAKAAERSGSFKWNELLPAIENDFGPIMEREYPVLRDIRLQLLERGAQAALLSGSGSTVFGVFSSEDSARSAADCLAGPGRRVWVTRTSRKPARPRLTSSGILD